MARGRLLGVRGWLPGVSLLLVGGAKHALANKRGLTALGEAVAGGHLDVTRHLVAAGADVHAGAGGGYNLLHVAAGLGHAGCLKLLIDSGLSPAAAGGGSGGGDGASPLHAAALAGSVECAEALLARGADPLAASADGRLASQVVEASTPLVAETLKALLQKAEAKARKGGGGAKAAAVAPPPPPEQAAAAPEEEAGGGGDAAAAYARVFGRLAAQEQERRIDGFARMAAGEVAGLDFLKQDVKEAVAQVRRAQQLLACFRAVAAIHRDERFQEDAADPRVQRAIEEIKETGAIDKYATDGQVASVMGKLRKLQAVLRDNGAVRVGMDELLPQKGGPSLQEMMAADAARISELEAAHAAARAAAADALLSLPPGTTAARARARSGGGGLLARGGGAGAEIQPAAGGGGGAAEHEQEDEEEQDEFSNVERYSAAAGGVWRRRGGGKRAGKAASGVTVDAAAGDNSLDGAGGAEGEGEPLWKLQMRQAAKDTLHRIIRITLAFAFLMGVMWLCNMMPSQQADLSPEVQARLAALRAQALERRRQQLEEAAADGGGRVGGAGGGAAAVAGHGEL
ncbi:hypothetical protein MNEG_6110 [Monoraphidium neglectum]|uniref:Uncharacterized protein n=1 Tax=Monoraphidium neglectum TaxID=145388 RepID=A0A0D2L3S7_9CHLO|nr:hypothetical protein MNEG_6110 [Monoraphidium neglectum]KIZ01849.1 hypothetical protein MNEG_6110 [Monoraphidium neglectum]|eukprot:XP_013900868.1 hypothetical protein MNEG_6110 [Monoraphidium neglectum]